MYVYRLSYANSIAYLQTIVHIFNYLIKFTSLVVCCLFPYLLTSCMLVNTCIQSVYTTGFVVASVSTYLSN